jgi:hypothetical protein
MVMQFGSSRSLRTVFAGGNSKEQSGIFVRQSSHPHHKPFHGNQIGPEDAR